MYVALIHGKEKNYELWWKERNMGSLILKTVDNL